MSKNIVVGLVCVFVAVVVAVSTLPVFGAINSGAVTVENEGAGALRFDLVDSHSGFNISYDFGDDEITITNGSDVQTISYDSEDMITIYYADDNVCIWLDGTDFVILGITSDNSTQLGYLNDNFTVQRTLSGLTITCGEESANFNAPTWAFIPNSAGKYGYFDAGTEVSLPDGAKVAYVSDNFAGVYAYNGINNFDLPITLEPEISDNVLSGAKWIRAIEELEDDPQIIPFDPGTITPINPDNPIVIDDPDDPIVIDDPNVPMSVPTPSYTDGDWGYNVSGSEAFIVSYSGSGGDTVTIPATVGSNLPVTRVGIGQNNNTVFDPSITIGNLVIPSGVNRINAYAFKGCTGISSVTLPDTLKRIESSAFYGCTGLTGSLVLPNGLTTIANNAFFGCTGLTGTLTIPNSVTSIASSVFYNCSGFTGLVLPVNSLTTLGDDTFTNCTGLTGTLIVPGNIRVSDRSFSNCPGFTDLVISEGIIETYNGTFQLCSGLTSISLPSTLTNLQVNTFKGCTGLTGTLIVPGTLKTLQNYSYRGCSNLSALVLSEGIESIGLSAFYECYGIKEVLNFSDLEVTTTSFALNADEVRDYVNCMGYLAPVEYTTGSANDGPAYDLIGLIPLMFAVGAVLFTIGYMLLRRF